MVARAASLGELVAGVAHEINNPLAFVISHLATVRRSVAKLDSKFRAMIAHGKIIISTGADRDAYRISIAGVGIPEALRERILDPFFTTKPVGQGTGLGLSITYSIVRKHGGALEFGRAEGGGTEVVIRIPMPG